MTQQQQQQSQHKTEHSMTETKNVFDDQDFRRAAELIEHLKSDNLNLRVEGNNSLLYIAGALGEERTRVELIPFLEECTDDEDEVILVLAEKLGSLSDHIGGIQYLYLLFEPLKLLAAADEVNVKDAAINSMKTVIGKMTQNDILTHGIKLVEDLAKSEFFTSRISACGILPTLYGRLSPGSGDMMDTDDDIEPKSKRNVMRQILRTLCSDSSAAVKRVSANALGSIAAIAESPVVFEELLSLFEFLSRDEQDNVRLQIIGNCIAFGKVAPNEIKSNRIIPILKHAANDSSWRVRWSIASKYHEAASALLVGETLSSTLCESYKQLLQDQEAEVRTAAATGIALVGSLMGSTGVFEILLPCLGQLVVDGCDHVRSALASVICDIAPLLGKDATHNHLVPLLRQLLRDSNSEVRLNVISKLHGIDEVLGMEHIFQSLLPAIGELAADDKWRVRKAIIEHIPLLARQLGIMFFPDSLSTLCLGWLGDHVYDVRMAAALNLKELCSLFGSAWTKRLVIPKLMKMQTDSSFLERLTFLNAINVLASELEVEILQREILPIVLNLSRDPVPNIRFNVCKTLEILSPRLGSMTADNVVRAALQELTDDDDRDVRYFSQKAILTLS